MKKSLLLFFAFLLSFGFSISEISAENFITKIYPFEYEALPGNAVRVPIVQIIIKATDRTSIKEIQIRRNGLSSFNDFGNVWGETNRSERSLRTKFLTDDVARIRFLQGIDLAQGEERMVTIYANTNSAITNGSVAFSVEKIISHYITDWGKSPIYFETVATKSNDSRKTRINPVRRSKLRCQNRRCYFN